MNQDDLHGTPAGHNGPDGPMGQALPENQVIARSSNGDHPVPPYREGDLPDARRARIAAKLVRTWLECGEPEPSLPLGARAYPPRFGDVLRETRTIKGISQRALTRILLDERMPNADYHGRISKIERGELKPPRDRAFYEGLGRAGFTTEEIARLLRCGDAPLYVDGASQVPAAASPPAGHGVRPLLVDIGGLRAEVRITDTSGRVLPEQVRALYRSIRPTLTLTLGLWRDRLDGPQADLGEQRGGPVRGAALDPAVQARDQRLLAAEQRLRDQAGADTDVPAPAPRQIAEPRPPRHGYPAGTGRPRAGRPRAGRFREAP